MTDTKEYQKARSDECNLHFGLNIKHEIQNESKNFNTYKHYLRDA